MNSYGFQWKNHVQQTEKSSSIGPLHCKRTTNTNYIQEQKCNGIGIFRLLNGENGLKLVKIDQKQVKMVKKLKNGQKPQKRPRFLADQKKALEKTLIEIGHFSSESGPPLGFEQKSSKNPIFDHFLSFFAVFCKKLTFLSRQAVCTLATCQICMCTIQILVQIPKNTRGMRKI